VSACQWLRLRLISMTNPAESLSAQPGSSGSNGPRAAVGAAIELLAARLDEIIAERLAPRLHGLPWTTILTELDRLRDRDPREYASTDLQAQLRILTERLGGMGYPLDTSDRRVSSLASLLRIARNRWAHMDSFTWLEAWRVTDAAQRLLTALGHQDAAAARLSAQAAAHYVHESGVAPTPPVAEPDDDSQPVEASHRAEVEPDLELLQRDTDATETPLLGTQRERYEPWPVVLSDDPGLLDELPKKAAKMQVRALAEEITEAEGPIHIDRLARLIGRSFGVSRLASKRSAKIKRQIRNCESITEDADHFLWPGSLHASTWLEFRPNDSDTEREFTEISPVEIRNAAAFIRRHHPDWSDDRLQRAVLATFGKKRLTKKTRAHLEAALAG
jgi:hypothetical protein